MKIRHPLCLRHPVHDAYDFTCVMYACDSPSSSMGLVPRINESWHVYMSNVINSRHDLCPLLVGSSSGLLHDWMSHVTFFTRLNTPCHTVKRVMSHLWMCHVMFSDEAGHTFWWGMPLVCMSHVTYLDASCHTSQWVMRCWHCGYKQFFPQLSFSDHTYPPHTHK